MVVYVGIVCCGIFKKVLTLFSKRFLTSFWFKDLIRHTMPLRMTCNLMRLEQHLDQCMVASFGYSIQLGLGAVHVAIPQAIYTSEKKKDLNLHMKVIVSYLMHLIMNHCFWTFLFKQNYENLQNRFFLKTLFVRISQ